MINHNDGRYGIIPERTWISQSLQGLATWTVERPKLPPAAASPYEYFVPRVTRSTDHRIQAAPSAICECRCYQLWFQGCFIADHPCQLTMQVGLTYHGCSQLDIICGVLLVPNLKWDCVVYKVAKIRASARSLRNPQFSHAVLDSTRPA
jgi:hypothetical protein